MKHTKVAVMAFALFTLLTKYAVAQSRQVEWSFDNRTNSRVDFKVNGHMACSANPMSICTSMEQDTDVHLEAYSDGELVKTRDLSRQEAANADYTWGVCIEGKTCPTN